MGKLESHFSNTLASSYFNGGEGVVVKRSKHSCGFKNHIKTKWTRGQKGGVCRLAPVGWNPALATILGRVWKKCLGSYGWNETPSVINTLQDGAYFAVSTFLYCPYCDWDSLNKLVHQHTVQDVIQCCKYLGDNFVTRVCVCPLRFEGGDVVL